jgi:geranylgeranyl diphosphate synthase type I
MPFVQGGCGMADEQTRVEAGRILQRFDEEVDGRIQSLLQQTDPTMANVASYFFGWVDESFNPIEGRQGKKLRSTLNLLVHEAVSGSFEPALPVAASVELIHNYSLIHDDALNVGNVLHALAFQSLHDLSGGLEPRFLEIREAIATTSLRLCQGQHWDLSFEKAVDVTQEMYLEMIAGKTAALIECSTYTGAVLATNGERLISAYRNFGNNLGFAFQIRDDFLNIWGDNAKVGKSQYSDLLRKKKTLPVVYALNALTGQRRERLAELYADVERAYVANG